MATSISAIIADAMERALREVPYDSGQEALHMLLGLPRMFYRDRLTRRRKNAFGDLIPQITIVRNNLRRLGKPKRKPVLPE